MNNQITYNILIDLIKLLIISRKMDKISGHKTILVALCYIYSLAK